MTNPRPERSHRLKLFRYGSLSVLFTGITFVGLAVLVGWLNFPAGWANFVIVAVCIAPNFELNRRWVWAAEGRPWWQSKKLVPFAVFSFMALGLSTFDVHEAGLAARHWSHADRALAAEAANLATFGGLWLIQYFLLDHVLFRARPSSAA